MSKAGLGGLPARQEELWRGRKRQPHLLRPLRQRTERSRSQCCPGVPRALRAGGVSASPKGCPQPYGAGAGQGVAHGGEDGLGHGTTQSWAHSSAAASSPSWPPSTALAAPQAPSCPQNTVAQPSLRPQEDEDGLGRIKGTVRWGRPWHVAAPCPPCTPPGRLPVSQRRAGLSWQRGIAHRRAQGKEEDGRYGARKGGRHVPACGTQPCARPGASPPPGAAFLPLHPP